MANWCTGSLKIRGKADDILKFFNEGLEVFVRDWNKKESVLVNKAKWLTINEFDDHYEVILEPPQGDSIYVKDTRRAFITTDTVDFIQIKKEDPTVIACCVMQAWGFAEEGWLALAKKYNLDFKLYGIESGIGFDQRIDIIGGEIAVSETDNYGSYEGFIWNCPFPWIGG